MMKCDKCVFWIHDPAPWDHPPEDIEGHCHRNPPVFDNVFFDYRRQDETEDLLGGPQSIFWSHPLTSSSDWCGEFKEKV